MLLIVSKIIQKVAALDIESGNNVSAEIHKPREIAIWSAGDAFIRTEIEAAHVCIKTNHKHTLYIYTCIRIDRRVNTPAPREIFHRFT